VKERLEQLSHWGNLSQDFDTGRATSLESYERTAYVYDLTPGGEAAFEVLATLEEALRRVAACRPSRCARSRRCSANSSPRCAPRRQTRSGSLRCARTCTRGSRA
jgi:hypothetical protein